MRGIRRDRLRGCAIVAAALVLLATAGCGAQDGQQPDESSPEAIAHVEADSQLEVEAIPQTGGRIVVDVPAEVNGLNPVVNQWSDAGSFFGASMLEPAAIVDAEGDWQPYLVESVTPSDEHRQWDVKLRPNITFHNGQPFDGAAFKQNLEAFYQGPLGKAVAGNTYRSVDVTSPLLVKVTLNERWAQFPASLGSLYIMAPEQLDAPDQGVFKAIGTGPFKFEEWVQGDHLRVTRNPTYWRRDDRGNRLPYLDAIEFRPKPDELDRQRALAQHDADLVLTQSERVAAALDPDFTVIRDYASERTFIMLNTAPVVGTDGSTAADVPNPLTNLRLRRALAYATDRQAVADMVGQNLTITTQGYRANSKWGLAEEAAGYPAYDPAKARDEVEAFRRESGQQSVRFSLSTYGNADNAAILQALADQWRKVGIEVDVEVIEQARLTILYALGYFQAGLFRWYGWTNPDSNYMFHSSTTASPVGGLSVNFTHHTSATMDDNLRKVRESTDFATRKAANDAVSREVNDQALALWLYDTPHAIAASPKLRGLDPFRLNPFGNFLPKPWWGEMWLAS